MTVADAKAQIRRDLTVDKLINKEITSHIIITDADVTNFYNANKQSFNLAEPQVHLAQILVTPFPNPNVRNLKNSKAQNEDEAQTKIRDIEQRLEAGRGFRHAGAELLRGPGFHAERRRHGLRPAIHPGEGQPGPAEDGGIAAAGSSIRRSIRTPDGYRILKVITSEPAGQRDLNDPRVQQNIRETLLNRKDQLLKAAYYEVARNNAKIRTTWRRGSSPGPGSKRSYIRILSATACASASIYSPRTSATTVRTASRIAGGRSAFSSTAQFAATKAPPGAAAARETSNRSEPPWPARTVERVRETGWNRRAPPAGVTTEVPGGANFRHVFIEHAAFALGLCGAGIVGKENRFLPLPNRQVRQAERPPRAGIPHQPQQTDTPHGRLHHLAAELL